MTDVTTCRVSSTAARLSFYRHGADRPNVSVASAYDRPALVIRIDDNAPVRMGDDAWTRRRALDKLLPQLETGQRIRTQYRDYPYTQDGDAPMCNLADLLRQC